MMSDMLKPPGLVEITPEVPEFAPPALSVPLPPQPTPNAPPGLVEITPDAPDTEDELQRILELQQAILRSDDPRGNTAIMDTAILMRDMYDIPVQVTLDNFEVVSEEIFGKALPPETALGEIRENWRLGQINNEIGLLYYEISNGNENPALLARIEELQAGMPSYEEQFNGLPARALKAAAEFLPMMFEGMGRGAREGLVMGSAAAAAAAVPAAAGALPSLGASLWTPVAAFTAMYSVGTVHGATEYIRKVEQGLAYMDMINDPDLANVDQRIIAAAASGVGWVNAALEMLQISKVPGLNQVLGRAATRSVRNMIMNRSFVQVVKRAAGRYVTDLSQETLQEIAQETTVILANELLAEMADETGGYAADWQEISGRLLETAEQAALGFGVVQLAGVPGGVLRDVQTNQRARGLMVQGADPESVAEAAVRALEATPETRAEQLAQRAIASAEQTEQQQAVEDAVVRSEDGTMFNEEIQLATTREGASMILKAGNPETGERYGHVTYEVEPDRIYIKEVESVAGDQRRELILDVAARHPGVEIVWDIVEDIEEPAETSNLELKQQIIEENPRGAEFGLQHFDRPTETAPATETVDVASATPEAVTGQETAPGQFVPPPKMEMTDQRRLDALESQRDILQTEFDQVRGTTRSDFYEDKLQSVERDITELKTKMAESPAVAQTPLTSAVFVQRVAKQFNVGNREARGLSGFIETVAKVQSQTTGTEVTPDQYVSSIFKPEVIQEGQAVTQGLRKEGGLAQTGFFVGDLQINPLEVDEFKGQVRAVMSAVEGADFHHAVHEIFHAIERLALTPEQIGLMETAVGKTREQWTVDDIEHLADRFENYLGTGIAPTAELQTLFEQIADLLWQLVSYIRDHLSPDVAAERQAIGEKTGVRISPEFEAAFDSMVTMQRRASPEAQKATAPVAERVTDAIIAPEIQPPDPAPVATAFDPGIVPVVMVSVADIQKTRELENFKEDAGQDGIVEGLKSDQYIGVDPPVPSYPVMLWERLDGTLEVITGWHRVDLARRLGIEAIPGQIVREADGFTAAMAMTQDAESNIREEKGTVKDYANYFRFSDPEALSEEQASSRGLLDSDKGRKGFAIGRHASDNLYTLYRNGGIGETKAAAVAATAPGNEGVQDVGIKRAKDLAADELVNFLNILKAAAPENEVEQVDLFGRNESFMLDAAALAKEAVKKTKELKAEYSALRSAVTLSTAAKRKVVEQYGFDSGDTDAMRRRVQELAVEIEGWTDWVTDAEKHDELRERMEEGILFHKASLSKAAEATTFPFSGETTSEAEAAYGSVEAAGAAAAEVSEQLALDFEDKNLHLWSPEPKPSWATAEKTVPGDWEKAKRVDFRGQEVSGPRDLARLFQVYRHPRLEHFHIILTKAGKIVSHNAMSSGVPARTRTLPGKSYPKALYGLMRRAEKLEADGMWILHNHPSGSVTPSIEDARVTGQFAALAPDTFRGSIVIDHGEFSFMSPDAAKSVVEAGWGGTAITHETASYDLAGEYETSAAGPGINSPGDLARVYHQAVNGEHPTVIAVLDGQHRVVAIVPVNGAKLKYQTVYQTMKDHGGVATALIFEGEGPAAENFEGDRTTAYQRALSLTQNTPDRYRTTLDVVSVSKTAQGGFDYRSALEGDKYLPKADWQTYAVRPSSFLYHHDIESQSVMALKAKKLFGITPDPNEAGYILPDGDMLDFSGRHMETDQESKDYFFGKRTLDHRHLFGIRGGNPLKLKGAGTDAMLEFQRRAGALRIDVKAGVISTLTMPTPAQLRQAVKAMNESEGSLYVALEDSTGRGVAMWQGMRATVGALQKFFVENGRKNNLVSTLLHRDPAPWILKSVEILRAKMQGPMPGTNIKAMLNKAGVKPDEMKWLNLDEYLETSEKRTLDDVLEYIEQNDVKVEEVTYGADAMASRAEISGDEQALLDRAETGSFTEGPSRYEDWQLNKGAAGREGTYGELLLTIPEIGRKERPERLTELPAGYDVSFDQSQPWESRYVVLPPRQGHGKPFYGRHRSAEMAKSTALAYLNLHRQQAWKRSGLMYGTQHWDESNVVAFARYKLHSAVEGPVLLIEEIQSDWHQKGRQEGYQSDNAEYNAVVRKIKETYPETPADHNRWSAILLRDSGVSEAEISTWFELLRKAQPEAVPDAPFKKTWHELTFRRMLRFATEAGVDRIAWTTGQQQADRYQLSNFIDRVHISKWSDGWALRADKGDSPVLSEEGDSPDAFVPFVGKELVNRAVEEIGDKPLGEAVFEGLEMNVGGEGMKAFYDKILVNYANKYGKKWGAKVEDAQIETAVEENMFKTEPTGVVKSVSGMGRYTIAFRDSDLTWGAFDAKADAERVFQNLRKNWESGAPIVPVTVHSMPITPEMKKSVSQGQYLFHYDDAWAGNFIYGTPVSKEIYQSYVDQANIYDSSAEFVQAMKDKYGEFFLGDMDEKKLSEFFDQAWKDAQEEKVTGPQGQIEMPKLDVEYDYKAKIDAAAGIEDSDIAQRIESGEFTEADVNRLNLEADEELDKLRAQAEETERADRAGRDELSGEEQILINMGDELESAITGLEEIPKDSARRDKAQARVDELHDRFRKALMADLDTAEIVLEEMVWQKAIVMAESVEEPDLVGRMGESYEKAVALGRDLQKALGETKTKEALATRGEKHKASKAKIYAKKREDLRKAKNDIRMAQFKRDSARKLREARIKLMKQILLPPGQGVEYRGYSEQIREIQTALDPLSPKERTKYRKIQSKKFRQDNPGVETYMTQDWLEEIYAKSWKTMTIAELEQVLGIITTLRKEGIRKRSDFVEAKRLKREVQSGRVANAILRGKPPETPVGAPPRSARWLRAILPTWKPDRVAQFLDKLKRGPVFRWLQDEPNKAWENMERAVDRRRTPVLEKMKELKITMDPLAAIKRAKGWTWLGRKLELGGFKYGYKDKKTTAPTAEEALFWMIGMNNPKTRDALLYGNELPESIILSGIAQLTDAEIELAAAIQQDFEENFPRLRDAFIETFNMDLPGEAFYVPMRRLEISYETRGDEIAADLVSRNGLQKRYVDRNPTHTRIEISPEHQKPIRTKLVSLWVEAVRTQEGFIHQDAMIKDLHAIMESDVVKHAVQQKYGSTMNKWIRKYVNDLSQSDAYQSQEGIEKFSRLMRTNAAISWLSFSLPTVMKQMTGPVNYLADAGPHYLMLSAAQFLGGKVKGVKDNGVLSNAMIDWVDEHTEVCRHRRISQELEDVKRLDYTLYQNLIKKFGGTGMAGLEAMDKLTVYIGWKAVYDKTLHKTKDPEVAKYAADRATVRTQPSSRVQDMAEIYRGGEFLKWFTMFTSELSVIWNRISFDIPVAVKRMELVRAMVDAAAVGTVGLCIAVASGALYKDDDDEKKKALLLGTFSEGLEAIPFIGRDISNMVRGEYWNTGVNMVPSLEYLTRIPGQMGREDWEAAATSAARFLTQATGMPMTGAIRAINAMRKEDLAELMGWKK